MQNYTIFVANGDEQMLHDVADKIIDRGASVQHVFKILRLIIARTNNPEILKDIENIVSIEDEYSKEI